MRAGPIALISDVHGNLPALEAVLADVEADGISRIWCLGDTLGYGPFPIECLDLVRGRCEVVLAGNHDLAVRGDLPMSMFGGSAGAGVRHAMDLLDAPGREYLSTLRSHRVMPEDGVEIYHASVRDPVWEYVRDERVATLHLSEQRLPLSIVGHTHAQLAFELVDGESWASGGMRAAGDVVDLAAGVRRVVNPGGVGQPRDRDPRAGWAVLEPGERLTFRRSEYDIERMCAAIEQAGLPAESGERLVLGW